MRLKALQTVVKEAIICILKRPSWAVPVAADICWKGETLRRA